MASLPSQRRAPLAPHLEIKSVLGVGGTAIVYDAYHSRLQALVAVKVLTLDGDQSREGATRLVRGARICARIDDAHTPRVYDVSKLVDGRPYVVMERVTGRTLGDRLGWGPLPIPLVEHVARELLAALHVVHGSGVVHCNLKPENVILQSAPGLAPRMRLMDFGVAHVMARVAPGSQRSPTRRGGIGTPGYMAPEQVEARDVDQRTDLYSLGVLLYEMLTRQCPFNEENTAAQLRATLTRDVPNPRRLRRDCPKHLADLVLKATRRDPAQRFASALEMAAALSKVHQRSKPRWVRALYGLAGAATALTLSVFGECRTARLLTDELNSSVVLTDQARRTAPREQCGRAGGPDSPW